VRGIDALLADGTSAYFGEVPDDLGAIDGPPGFPTLVGDLRAIAESVVGDLSSDRWPKLLRRVGGYNIDSLAPQRIEGLKRNRPGHNLAHLLVGSEGTLGFFTRLHLDLQPLPKAKVLGVCHFPSFYQAMELTQHIVKLEPAAVELVDRTMIELGREIPAFRPVLDRVVRGQPDALLLVEFAGDDLEPELTRLKRLGELLADLGLPDSVVEVTGPALQTQVWEVRKQGLNIMMSMKGDGKPVSFIEDCAVPLDKLAEYTDRLTRLFAKYGTRGTWYAHASVGCLHVRPILNMKEPDGARKMRAIAEEAFAIVREYKGSHSGEHGDGLVRSEFHEPMYGSAIVRAFEQVKDRFDPDGLFNPGKIVDAPKMDDRSLFRYAPGYAALPFEPALDWSAWGGFPQAVEMCNNNGACRKADVGVMCPSYRVTGDEKHLTRGRANTLRLALTGQLGPDALIADEMRETLSLCVGCKGCKRECPTGVDMARMKIEILNHWQKRRGLRPGERLVAFLPRYAPWAARFPWLANARDLIPGAARIAEPVLGFSRQRAMPAWRSDPFRPPAEAPEPLPGREVVLLVDTFNTYFEPENAHAAARVLRAAGYAVHFPTPPDGGRPLCCGRTFLAAGLVDEAREEAKRMLAGLAPHLEAGRPIIGLEPSCLLTLRDELLALLPGEETEILSAKAFLFEEFLAAEDRAKRLSFPLRSIPERRALVHGHCHQKAFAAMGAVEATLRLIPGLEVETIDSSCCGMAGAFGYQTATYEVSMAMAELSLLPAVRSAGPPRCRRHQLPPSDPGRRRPGCGPRRAGVGIGPGAAGLTGGRRRPKLALATAGVSSGSAVPPGGLRQTHRT
jgi:Fe-S oxidoreductase/FAD/FMN-containing dehydrogenase